LPRERAAMFKSLFSGSRYLVVVLIVNVAILATVLLVPFPGEEMEHRICDQAVKTVLTSESLVEVERSVFLVDRLHCSVRRRLPDR
jgi:hypothetical protein